MKFFGVLRSRYFYLGILCLTLVLTIMASSGNLSADGYAVQTACGSGSTCPAGTSCCDNGKACCKDGTPHYCPSLNMCYQTAAQASAACGNQYKVCYK